MKSAEEIARHLAGFPPLVVANGEATCGLCQSIFKTYTLDSYDPLKHSLHCLYRHACEAFPSAYRPLALANCTGCGRRFPVILHGLDGVMVDLVLEHIREQIRVAHRQLTQGHCSGHPEIEIPGFLEQRLGGRKP